MSEHEIEVKGPGYFGETFIVCGSCSDEFTGSSREDLLDFLVKHEILDHPIPFRFVPRRDGNDSQPI